VVAKNRKKSGTVMENAEWNNGTAQSKTGESGSNGRKKIVVSL
jgi:hypothetical protein